MMLKQLPIAILGAGSWGTALAILLARNGNLVHLWGNEPDAMRVIAQKRINQRYLPDSILPENISIFTDLAASLDDVQDIFIVVPSHAFRSVCLRIKTLVSPNVRIGWGTKGLDADSGCLLSEVVVQCFSASTPVAALSGPSFAKELAKDLPTAVSLAGNNAIFVRDLIERFHSDRFRVYENCDMVGVQLCGALKNVLAIAIGVADGLEMGANTRCALITRGLAEMARLCVAMGGSEHTVMTLAGVGDLVLTATDNLSRNRRLGLAIGKGIAVEAARAEIGQAVEGLTNTRQIKILAERLRVEMPIVNQVDSILFQGQPPQQVVSELLERAPKSE